MRLTACSEPSSENVVPSRGLVLVTMRGLDEAIRASSPARPGRFLDGLDPGGLVERLSCKQVVEQVGYRGNCFPGRATPDPRGSRAHLSIEARDKNKPDGGRPG